MANIFAIITAVLLAASAFIAFKNQEKYADEIENRKIAETHLHTSQVRLKGLRDNRDDTIDKRKGVVSDTVVKRDEEKAEQAMNEKMTSDIGEKKSESQRNAEKIKEIEDQTKELGDIQELAGKIKRLQQTITGLMDDKLAKEAMFANLLSEKANTKDTIKRYNNINTWVTSKKSYFPSARITAIYGPWGFVTLSSGNSAGVVAGSSLDVVRGAEVIAKLRVRSVEASRASADVVPESLGEEVTLMVGDRVVPSAKPAPTRKASEEPEAAEEPEATEDPLEAETAE